MQFVSKLCLCFFSAIVILTISGNAAWARSPYTGLGTWVDHFDTAAWYNPNDTAKVLRAQRVCSFFAQTSN